MMLGTTNIKYMIRVFITFTRLMEENLNQSNNPLMLYICLIYVNKVPEDDLRKIETCRNFDGFCVKIYIILTYSEFFGITQ